MSKRDYVAEILSKKSRLYPSTHRWEQVSGLLDGLIQALYETQHHMPFGGAREEVLSYFPIRLVAVIEGYFRLAYANLIDFGSPFRENAAKFRDIRFGIDTAVALQQHSVSLGDFIAHLLPVNNLDDINLVMSTLLGTDFLQLFKETRLKLPVQMTLFPEEEGRLAGQVLAQVKAMFDLRHLMCHELAPTVPTDEEKIVAVSQAAVEFLWITEAVLGTVTAERIATPPHRPLLTRQDWMSRRWNENFD